MAAGWMRPTGGPGEHASCMCDACGTCLRGVLIGGAAVPIVPDSQVVRCSLYFTAACSLKVEQAWVHMRLQHA